MFDEETKQMVIKKTWCHGQLIAPLVGILCGWWAVARQPRAFISSFILACAAIVLPLWSVISYRAISTQPSYPVLLRWGALVEIAYLGIIILSSKHLHETWNLLMFIASGLLFVETLGFLVIVTSFRSSLVEAAGTSSLEPSSYTDFVDEPSNVADETVISNNT